MPLYGVDGGREISYILSARSEIRLEAIEPKGWLVMGTLCKGGTGKGTTNSARILSI